MPDSQKWYGWIPILSDKLDRSELISPEEDIFPRKNSDTDKKQEIDGIFHYENNIVNKITLYIPEIGDSLVDFNIEKTGLTSFSFTKIEIEDPLKSKIFNETNLPIFIFDIIRDMYHKHVHHEIDDDCKLQPVKANNDEEAIKIILEQYRQKIIQYHQDRKSSSKNIISNFFQMRKQLNVINTGIGEFTYAKSFINLNFDTIPDVSKVIKSFDNAIKSLNVLKDKFSWELIYLITFITGIIALLQFLNIDIKSILNYICCFFNNLFSNSP